jgi:2-C-methyl-D-erythritol 4-phosphate cytidylyltransferase
MTRVAVILPAAGNSTRFGGPTKKPFLHLAGRPVWVHAAERFWHRPDVVAVLLAVAPADRGEFQPYLQANARLVDGGAERFESVANALAQVPDCDLVAVHDAVRPLTSPELIDAVFAAAAEHGAALPAVPVADTLKRAAGDVVTETVPRAGLWQAQTPQVARRDWLADAYARRASLGGPITDDAQLLEACGYPVRVVPGDRRNFKLTTPDDLRLAEALTSSPKR